MKDIFEFLQYCVGSRREIPKSVSVLAWDEVYGFAKEQTLVGVCFEGIQRMGNELKEINPIPQKLLMRWMGEAELIRRSNVHLNMTAVKVYAQLQKDRLRGCVLKGQGNARMYPNPYARMPGDIDIWVDADRPTIIEYVKKHFGLLEMVSFQHAVTQMDGVSLELHFIPNLMNNPIYNHRLQKWFREHAESQFGHVVDLPDGVGSIAVPTLAFNLVYQLSHMQHHFFDEGLGLRQLCDYYYVVTQSHTEKTTLERDLKHLGLWKFARAVMYVLHEVFGLQETDMPVHMDKKRGEILLREILNGGNFGRYDAKYGDLTKQPKPKKFFLKTWRVCHFVRYYPEEALCEPFFRTYHFFWRRWINYVLPSIKR